MTDLIASACRQWRQQYELSAAYPWRASFTTDEIHAAEIEAARDAVLIRLYDWIMAGANDAQTAFTSSELRNVAREAEYRIHADREEGRREGMMEERMRCIQLVRDEPEFPGATHDDVAPVVQRAMEDGAAQVVIQWAAHKAKECIISAIEAKAKEG